MSISTRVRPDGSSVAGPSRGRRLGYLIAIGVNGALLLVVTTVGVDEHLGFVTEDFDRVAGFVVLTLVASLAVNLAYLFYDRPWFKSLGQILTSLTGALAAVRLRAVFPFDYSAYDTDWTFPTKVALVLVIVGGLIGALVELVKLLSTASPAEPAP